MVDILGAKNIVEVTCVAPNAPPSGIHHFIRGRSSAAPLELKPATTDRHAAGFRAKRTAQQPQTPMLPAVKDTHAAIERSGRRSAILRLSAVCRG